MTDGGDPSTRTIEQLRMATDHARELSDAKFDNFDNQLREKDKAIKLVQERVNSQPTPDVLHEQIVALKDSLKTQLDALYKYMEAMAESNKESLSLALTSQQDAAKETKAALEKQLESLNVRFNDSREQIAAVVYSDKGSKQSNASAIAIGALLIGAVGAVLALASFMIKGVA